MSPVFTIFCHGTGSHRTRTDGELVTEFGKRATGEEYRDYLILDGPGSAGGIGGSTIDPANPLPGTFDPYTRDKTPKSAEALRAAGFDPKTGLRVDLTAPKGSKVTVGPKFMDLSNSSNTGGELTGSGWDDNVIHAMATISELTTLPDRINMVGWSRGAVTCTKIAYQLNQIYPQVAVNIFAIDPVAGPGNRKGTRGAGGRMEDTSTIQANVRNYLATLMADERRKIMQPQDMGRVTISKMTNAIFLPFPGIHDSAVMNRASEGEVAQVVWSLAYAFLKHFGTRFDTPPSPKYLGQEMCNFYGRMRAKQADYAQLFKKEISWKHKALGVQNRNFVAAQDKYVVEADYFINEHHREVFIRTYPRVYEFLFEGREGLEQLVWTEFKSMYNLLGLMKSLAIYGVKRPAQGHPFVLPPPGIGRSRGGAGEMGVRGSLLSMGVF